MRPNISTGQTNGWLLTLALALLVTNEVGAQGTETTTTICSAAAVNPSTARSLPVAFYIPDFTGTSLNRVTIWLSQPRGASGVCGFRLTVRSDTYDGPLIGTKTIDFALLPVPNYQGKEFQFEDPAVEPGSRVTFLLEKVSGPDVGVTVLGSDNFDTYCGVIPTTAVPPLGDRLDDGWVPALIILGGALPTDQIRFECLPSFPSGPSGDDLSRGFYVEEYNGTGLSRVEIWVHPTELGHFRIRLTIRRDAYDGEEIGTATAEADLLADHVTPLFFELGHRSVPYRGRLTFTLEKLSGPGSLFYMLARESCPGVVQTEGTNPPLDTPRGNGRSVGLRIWEDGPGVFTFALAPAGESPAPAGDTVVERDVPPGVHLIEVNAFLKSSGLPGPYGPVAWGLSIAHDPCMSVDSATIQGVKVLTIYDPSRDPTIFDLKYADFQDVQTATGDYPGSPVPGAQGVISAIGMRTTEKLTLRANAIDPVLLITYRIDVPAGETVACGARFEDWLKGRGSPAKNSVGYEGSIRIPVTQGLVLRLRNPSGFLRGDCNGDGGVDISDAIQTLGVLFLGQGTFPCKDACDSNDDGRIDISDAINTLGVLFLGQGTIPLPGNKTCGVDPTGDDAQLTCESYSRCP